MRLTAEQYAALTDHERRMFILGATVAYRIHLIESPFEHGQDFLTDPNYKSAAATARDYRYN